MAEEIQEPITLQVSEKDSATERLDLFLTQQLPDLSRSRVQNLIKAGNVSVNGQQQMKAKHPVGVGDKVIVDIPPPAPAEPQPEDLPLEVLHEDNHIIVVNKTAGVVVHPGSGNASGTLVNALLHHCQGALSKIGDPERPGVVHRLDKDTSGCLVAAKTGKAHHGLVEAFAGRDVKKEYRCVVV
ncbi:MAG: pseudouridine synthase, partial [Verrucomicrobiota bacterium]